MSNDPIPTFQQLDTLRGLIRCGCTLTDVQRGHLARLLDEIGWTVQTCAKAAKRYPHCRELQNAWLLACWGPVRAAYSNLMQEVPR